MKNFFIILLIIVVILVLGFLGWQFLFKKSIEGQACKSESNCQTGLKCIVNICSSGKVSSACLSKTDCLTPFCVQGKCTEGKENEICTTYKDCQEGLFCKQGVCSEPPSYSQYFNKVVISKMKIGLPPGSDNIPVATNEFKTTDAIEIDLTGVKPTTIGEFYYEVVDSVTGEVVFSTSNYKQAIEGEDIGTGSDLPRIIGEGEFELNIYYNDQLVYTTVIKVID